MKNVLHALTLGLSLLLVGWAFAHCGHCGVGEAVAAEHDHDHGTSSVASEAVTPDAVEVGNKICPVSKEKVGEMGEVVKHEYNGKIYNFCCKMCLKDFQKDPEKYSKIAEDEAAK